MLLRSIAPVLGLLAVTALCVSACSGGSCEAEASASQRAAVVLAGAAGEAAGGAAGAGEGGAGGQSQAGEGGENTGAVPSCPHKPGTNRVVYDGSGQGATCTSALRAPFNGEWYVADDGTATQTTDVPNGEHGGVDGANDCAMHSAGEGFTGWGGVTLYLDDFPVCPYDLSNAAGVRVKLKGKSQGTQGACGPADNLVFLKVGTLATTPESTGGACVSPSDPNAPGCWDDFGGFCTLSPDWTTCDVWFSELRQRGWGIPVEFHASEVLTLTFLALGQDLSWDFWVDDVSFIPGTEVSPGRGSGNECPVDQGGSGGAAAGGNGGGGGSTASAGTAGNPAGGKPSTSAGAGGTTSATAGTANAGTAPASADAGKAQAGAAGDAPGTSSDAGCSCRLERSRGPSRGGAVGALLGLTIAWRARRKRRRSASVASRSRFVMG